MSPLPTTEEDLDLFLRSFEHATLPKAEWTHAAHIFTGSAYVHTLGEAEAICRMRTSVRRYNEAVGGQNTATSGYHETVSVFWIKLLAAFHQQHATLTRSAFAHHAVRSLASRRDILHEFYDLDITRSVEARRIWVEPTRKPISAATW